MDLTPLGLNKPLPDGRGVNFSDRNSVEQFLETKRFRPCANLKCEPASLPNIKLYVPMCLENYFAKEGVARYFDLPDVSRPLSPLTYTTIHEWAPFISCPRDCKGYQNRKIAKLKHTANMVANTLHPREWMNAAVWAWIVKWKFWVLVWSVVVAIVMKHLIG
jgi:hypothetical protein